jgi:hypothetical protein
VDAPGPAMNRFAGGKARNKKGVRAGGVRAFDWHERHDCHGMISVFEEGLTANAGKSGNT